MQRVGMYGGTFDPPHRGHFAVAEAALNTFALDEVRLCPTGRQPLKSRPAVATFPQRMEMVHLLCGHGNASIAASDGDAPREDKQPNYTVDLLRRVRSPEAKLFCIVGADSFLDLRKWREPDELLRLAEWIVVSRPGYSLEDLSTLQLNVDQMTRVHLLQTVHVPISATGIRAKLARGEDCPDELTPGVMRYIREHHLYT